MSFLLWFQRLFVPKEPDADDPSGELNLETASSHLWGQHMRIVLAILVVFISALVMWWIVA